MFVSVKLCDLVGFPTIPGKNSKCAFWKNLVLPDANRLLADSNRLLSLLNEFFFVQTQVQSIAVLCKSIALL